MTEHGPITRHGPVTGLDRPHTIEPAGVDGFRPICKCGKPMKPAKTRGAANATAQRHYKAANRGGDDG